MKIENVRVQRGGNQYCLAWTVEHHGYHIWLNAKTYAVEGGMRPLFRKPVAGEKEVQRLSLLTPKNKALVDDAIAEATVQHLFEQHEQALAAEEQKRQEEHTKRQALELVRNAAPEMLAALEVLVGDDDSGLSYQERCIKACGLARVAILKAKGAQQ